MTTLQRNELPRPMFGAAFPEKEGARETILNNSIPLFILGLSSILSPRNV